MTRNKFVSYINLIRLCLFTGDSDSNNANGNEREGILHKYFNLKIRNKTESVIRANRVLVRRFSELAIWQ